MHAPVAARASSLRVVIAACTALDWEKVETHGDRLVAALAGFSAPGAVHTAIFIHRWHG
jgi:hypothetical protein